MVVYDYHPNSQTLFEAHIKSKAPQFQNGRLQAQHSRIGERTLWSYIVQIANAIKAVHDAGMAVRIIDATKILVTSENRCDTCMSCCEGEGLLTAWLQGPHQLVRRHRRAHV